MRLRKKASTVALAVNVAIRVTDAETGRLKQCIMAHNAVQPFALDAVAQWLTGVNNTGFSALERPTQMQLGNGSGSTFAPVAGTLKTISYAKFQGNGQMLAVAQWVASDPAGTFTQFQWQDTDGNPWFFVTPATPVSKTSSQNLTLEWTVTAANA